jgi:hypothetical protein
VGQSLQEGQSVVGRAGGEHPVVRGETVPQRRGGDEYVTLVATDDEKHGRPPVARGSAVVDRWDLAVLGGPSGLRHWGTVLS